MGSFASSGGVRNAVIALCAVLAANALDLLYPLPHMDYAIYGAANVVAFAVIAALAWRGVRYWPVVALVVCPYLLTYTAISWSKDPSIVPQLFHALMNLGRPGVEQFWHGMVIPVLSLGVGILALAALRGCALPWLRTALVSVLSALALVIVAVERINALEVEAAGQRKAHQLARQKYADRPAPDQAERSLPANYAKPSSAWLANEKVFYERLLAGGRFDLLVVPCQVQDFAVDRATRSFITARISLAVAAEGKQRTPDPYLVMRALGDGQRRLTNDTVYRLAERLEAKRILWCYIGHDRKGQLQLTIQHEDRGGGQVLVPGLDLRTQKFQKLAFSDELPPIEAVHALLPEVLKAIGVDSAALEIAPRDTAGPGALPDSPAKLLTDTSDAGRNAFYFQLLAALAPAKAERARERLIEKSLLALQRVPRASSEYRTLKARAYMQLGLRIAAQKALGEPQTPEEHYLAALLNGNLPEAQRLAAQTPAEKAFLTALELNAIASEYGARTRQGSLERAQELKLPGGIWPALAARAFTDWDAWSQFDNAELKALLDTEFPLAGFTLESIIQGAGAISDMSRARVEVNLSVLSHVRRVIEANGQKWCCQPPGADPTALDYLDLIEAIGTDNLMRAATFLTQIQGTPERGLEALAQIESAYKDHPQFAVARADAQLKLASGSGRPAREGLLRSAYGHALDAFYWEQGQTRTVTDAFQLLTQMPWDERLGRYDNPYAGDYPFKGFYSQWEAGGNMERSIANMQAALANTSVEFRPVEVLNHAFGEMLNKPEEVERLLSSIENRFQGHPNRALLFAENARKRGDAVSAARYYGEGIEAQPHNWSAYFKLGKHLFEEGEEEKAAKAFLRYPGFNDPTKENPVGVANHAFEAGSLLFWSGNFAHALPLYRIAADLRTGSYASISSELRLRLLNGDYETAMRLSLERGRRYRSHFGFRDYFGLLHAMGHSQQAWAGFNTLVSQLDHPELWETALVGHRKERSTDEQIAAWAAQEPMSKAGIYTGYAALYLVRAGVTDRRPTKQLASLVESLDRPVWKVFSVRNHIVRPSTNGDTPQVVGPTAPPGASLPLGVFESASKTKVTSDLVYFVQGYEALRRNDYAAARAVFQEASTFYDFVNVSLGYMLPYYAFAAAKSGDVTAVETLLASFKPEHQRFDYHLAKAVLAGIARKPDESLRALKIALHRRPFTELRPVFTEYQYAEIAEWLYETTRDAKFRDAMLAWARSNQSFAPWFAWPHAMVAKHSRDRSERRRAIALAQHLDPGSERLSAVARKDLVTAAREYAPRNPFLKIAPPSKDESTQ